MLRRLLLQRAIELVIVFLGVTLGLRWVGVGAVDNSGAATAARTFNRAVVDHRNGRARLREARAAVGEEEWRRADDLYHDAHVEYYEAHGKYGNARREARRVNCDALATAADRYRTYCHHMENACSAWARAAELRADGHFDDAEDRRAEGDELRERANAVVDTRIPDERDPKEPVC